MSVKKFRFVSPGVFINEIDNSQLPARAAGIGPVVIGRSERGPSMRPVTITSFSEFVEMFGNPIPGGEGGDIWRDGNRTAPTYGAYAAQAYLRSSSPLTFIRLLGHEHEDATAAGAAGWAMDADGDKAGGAFGLFIGSMVNEVDDTVAPAAEIPEVAGVEATLAVSGLALTQKETGVNTDSVEVTVATAPRVAPNVGVEISGTVDNLTIAIENHNNGAGEVVTLQMSQLVDILSGGAVPAEVVLTDAEGLIAGLTFDAALVGADGDVPAGDGSFDGGVDFEALVPAVAARADGPDENFDMHLAAIIYSTDSQLGISGKNLKGENKTKTQGEFLRLQGTDGEVKLNISDVNYSANFNTGSKKYIRKVLNTNPTLTNSAHTRAEGEETHFLGETFDSFIADQAGDLPDAENGLAILVRLDGAGGKLDKSDQSQGAQGPKSGWVISQHKGSFTDHAVDSKTGSYVSGVTKLFRFEGLDDGAWAGQNLKIEISNIKASDDDFNAYGSFTVTLRRAGDSDQAPQYVERYTSVNLNPASTDYIARRIGDMRSEWSYSEGRYRMLGQYPSLSRFIRVVMNDDVDAGVADPDLVPFGFMGPPSPRTVQINVVEDGDISAAAIPITGAEDADALSTHALDAHVGYTHPGTNGFTANLIFPSQACRQDSEQGRLSSGDLASFGATSNDAGGIRADKSFGELLHPYSAEISNHDGESTLEGAMLTRPALRCASTFDITSSLMTPIDGLTQEAVNKDAGVIEHSVAGKVATVPCFTLDDLVVKSVDIGGGVDKPSKQHVQWRPGARRAGASLSVLGDVFTIADGATPPTDWTSEDPKDLTDAEASAEATGDYKDVLQHGYDSFCMPLVGGCDGVDITQKEPFSEAELADGSPESNYAYNSVKRAIDTIRDPEVVECNIATVPGVCNESLTSHLLTVCEARADALAIIDVKGDYQPSTDNTNPERLRLPNVRNAVRSMKDRRLNSSYGCAYFPWVQVRDTISDAVLWVPPSVVALGTMSSSQKKTEVWFAPAGFNRGGLTEGSAGLPVPQVRYRLTSKERDALYEANINPIATFPSEGIVIFGQKTLQVTPSALDRINVRRLMIFLKKQVSRIASTILFDPNVETTWQRFTAQVEPFLASVKSRFGLTEFRVILDETTTTPDLVDRNILYAKIMLKPARAIEFIALDFVITRSGASFDD